MTYVGPTPPNSDLPYLLPGSVSEGQEVKMILSVFALNHGLGGDGLRYPILK